MVLLSSILGEPTSLGPAVAGNISAETRPALPGPRYTTSSDVTGLRSASRFPGIAFLVKAGNRTVLRVLLSCRQVQPGDVRKEDVEEVEAASTFDPACEAFEAPSPLLRGGLVGAFHDAAVDLRA